MFVKSKSNLIVLFCRDIVCTFLKGTRFTMLGFAFVFVIFCKIHQICVTCHVLIEKSLFNKVHPSGTACDACYENWEPLLVLLGENRPNFLLHPNKEHGKHATKNRAAMRFHRKSRQTQHSIQNSCGLFFWEQKMATTKCHFSHNKRYLQERNNNISFYQWSFSGRLKWELQIHFTRVFLWLEVLFSPHIPPNPNIKTCSFLFHLPFSQWCLQRKRRPPPPSPASNFIICQWFLLKQLQEHWCLYKFLWKK